MATSNHQWRMEPCFKQHTAVDDKNGVIVDVAVTTGEASEGTQLMEQLERVKANTGCELKTVTADAGDAHSRNYAELEENEIEAVIPPQRESAVAHKLPARRFKYDARRQVVVEQPVVPVGRLVQRVRRGHPCNGARQAVALRVLFEFEHAALVA